MSLDLSGLDAPPPAEGAPAKAPLRKFEEDPENPRTEFDGPEFDAFVEDVKARGILQPVVVTKTQGGKLRIRFGARRFRAAQRLGLNMIPYVVANDERHLDAYAQVSENERRKNLEPLELARFVAKRVEAGDSKGFIAKNLGLPQSEITSLLTLIDPPPFIASLYESGKCRAAQTLYRLKKLHAINPALVERRVAESDAITRQSLDRLAGELDPQDGEKANPGEVAGPEAGSPESTAGQVLDGADARLQSTLQTQSPKRGTLPASVKHSARLRKPLLLAKHDGRDVMVMLSLRPTTRGRVFIRYEDDGSDAEVPCEAVTISQLTEASA